jgi:hypothetical protein
LDLQSLEVRGPSPDLERVFQAAHNQRRNALVFIASPLIRFYQKQIMGLAIKNRLPCIGEGSVFADAGALMLTDRILTQVIIVLPTSSIEFSTAADPPISPWSSSALNFSGAIRSNSF